MALKNRRRKRLSSRSDKLQLWLDENNIPIVISEDQVKQDWKKHNECMLAVSKVFFNLCDAKNEGYSLTDISPLKSIVQRNKLQCSEKDDLVTCMLIMVHLLDYAAWPA